MFFYLFDVQLKEADEVFRVQLEWVNKRQTSFSFQLLYYFLIKMYSIYSAANKLYKLLYCR